MDVFFNPSMTKLVLYEAPSSLPDCRPLSPFSATVRCALNYKKLAYHSSLVNLRDLQTFGRRIGAKPSSVFPDGSPKWTLPILIDETHGTRVTISDSFHIILYLETIYPDPTRPIFSSPRTYAVDRLAQVAIVDMIFPIVTRMDLYASVNAVAYVDRPFWIQRYLDGRNVYDLALPKHSEEYQRIMHKARRAFIQLSATLASAQGPGRRWYGGERPVYVDFFLISVLSMVQCVFPEIWKGELAGLDGGRLQRYLELDFCVAELLSFKPGFAPYSPEY